MTSECVRALSARNRTPRNRSPEETPVAATITSPREKSSIPNTRVTSSIPCSRAASISVLDVGHSWACIPPPRQRRAAADRAAWRVPPIPIARWSFVPRIAAEIDAVTSPSWISVIRAPEALISSISSCWRGRSSTIAVMSFGRRPNTSAIASMFSAIGRPRSIRSRAAGPTAILRMYMSGSGMSESGSPTATIDIAPYPPRATTPRPSRGSIARSTRSPPVPISPSSGSWSPPSSPPITMRPAIGICSSACLIPENAASWAASWSARPSQRAPASAARSVTRAYCSQRQSAVRPEFSATSVGSWTVSATASDPLSLLGARVDELEDAADRRLDAAAVLEHGHGGPFGAPHDVLLDPADVLERLDVLVVVAGAFGREVPDQEVGAVLLHGLDREYALHDERALDRRQHPRNEMHAFEHHRPAFLERALDRRTHADHDVARLREPESAEDP